MIKTGLFAVAKNNMDYCTLMEKAHAMGFEALELYCFDDLATPNLDAAKKIREKSQELDMSVDCVSVGSDLFTEKRKEEMERVRGYIDVAAHAGSKYAHFTLFPVLAHDPAGLPTGKVIKQLAPAVRELCEYGAERGIMCLCEGQGYYMNGIAPMDALMEQVDHPNFGLVADLGNPACVDEDPVDFIGHFGQHIKHVHLKDFKLRSSQPEDGLLWRNTKHGRYFRRVPVGTGDVDLVRAYRLLKQLNYQGCAVLEDQFVGHEAEREADLAVMKTLAETIYKD